jgi:hypothetical protein
MDETRGRFTDSGAPNPRQAEVDRTRDAATAGRLSARTTVERLSAPEPEAGSGGGEPEQRPRRE